MKIYYMMEYDEYGWVGGWLKVDWVGVETMEVKR